MSIFKKHRELILYLFFGVLTTAVDLGAFMLFSFLLGDDLYLISNLIAWALAVAFAFAVNKLVVFGSHSKESSTLVREISEFIGARIFSLIVEEAGLLLLVDGLGIGKISTSLLGFALTGQLISKAILAVIVVVLNYLFSKFIIFKKTKTP